MQILAPPYLWLLTTISNILQHIDNFRTNYIIFNNVAIFKKMVFKDKILVKENEIFFGIFRNIYFWKWNHQILINYMGWMHNQVAQY
jgi:hypothetical protein